MEKLLEYTLKNQLRVENAYDEVYGLLVTEAPGTSDDDREQLLTLLFETFEIH